MSFTVNLYYTGTNGSARAFANEMINQGIVKKIQAEPGNLKYDYFIPLEDPETILLIDSWANQAALDKHHASEMMVQIASLREKYDLHMRVERYTDDHSSTDDQFLRR
ncbi:antibiotic biosynthesis monooxygenase [Pediococcus stilesii]|uniref:Antibiotic biosynthesis monooxygenase n=1 Tax=Pediococcus stilesii TaxID=331679 RepID=A0A5R9BRT4_9LACO|nr:putative quinol monooxygenase [Pediococcus stilesii]TLQ03394.1 antibiotic biosynthesis monooxygenase [Pediococcus stilesii]